MQPMANMKPRAALHQSAPSVVKSFAELYPPLTPGALLTGTDDPRFAEAWAMADAHSFAPRRA